MSRRNPEQSPAKSPTIEVSIPWARPALGQREQEFVRQAIDSTWISRGPFVSRFEKDIAAYCGLPHALAVSSGTSALHVSMLAIGVSPGDEIVVPSYGFMAAANLALQMNAVPVFAEVDPRTWCVTAEAIAACLTSRTRAVVAVHTYGNMCPMEAINELAAQEKLPVIEDAAEAFGSRWQGALAGSLGDLGIFSFHAAKTITTGEGGMVVTRDDALHDLMKKFRNHGMSETAYRHELPGHNFRLSNLLAAIGCAQFERIDDFVAARKRIHDRYRERLQPESGICTQMFPPEVEPVLWSMAVKLDSKAYKSGRDAVIRKMGEAGIECKPGFVAASEMGIYRCPSRPVSEDLGQWIIGLPTYATLTDDEIGVVCESLVRCRS